VNNRIDVQNDPVNGIDPKGLVAWTGTIRQGSAAYGVGAIAMYATFESECKEGKKAIVEVLIVGPMMGLGGGYKNTAITGGKSSLHDYKDSINPSVFNGDASYAQINAVEYVGFSHSSGIFGDVFSDGKYGQFGIALGFDWSISIMYGSSTVMDVRWECCP
jgi:hypothetical protein